jgi:hypothetical protein
LLSGQVLILHPHPLPPARVQFVGEMSGSHPCSSAFIFKANKHFNVDHEIFVIAFFTVKFRKIFFPIILISQIAPAVETVEMYAQKFGISPRRGVRIRKTILSVVLHES